MSLLSSGGFFGRRRASPPRPQTWDPYQEHHHGSLVAPQPLPPPPYMAFPNEPSSQIINTRIEWNDTPEAHVYKAHLPGLKRSDVRVEVDDNRVLSVIGERSDEKEEQRGGWHRVELSSGHFVQRLTLPENSVVDHVKASMDSGVLTITVPKYNRGFNSRIRNINISSNGSH